MLASAPPLAERMRALPDHVVLAPNVADTALFATALEPGPLDPALAAVPAPRIVFVGAIAARKVDLALVAAIATARPAWSLVLVGPVGLGDPDTDVSALERLPNVHLLGPRAQRELPSVLRAADAGLIPYVSTRLTASIFPMKLYEYLSAGVPLVATGLPSVGEVRGRGRHRGRRGGDSGPGDGHRHRPRRPACAQPGRGRALMGDASGRDRGRVFPSGHRGRAVAVSDLFVTAMTPRLGSGTGLRSYGVIAALARLGPVEVRYVEFGAPEPAPEYGSMSAVTLSGVRASRGGRRAAAFARALSRQVPVDLARGVSPELVRAAAGAHESSRIIADGPVAAAALLGLASRRPVVYLAHNLESAGFRGQSRLGTLRRFERRVLPTFAESWMPTRADGAGARRLTGGRASTRYVPNVIDAAAITAVAPAGARRLVFVGDFTYAPNARGPGLSHRRGDARGMGERSDGAAAGGGSRTERAAASIRGSRRLASSDDLRDAYAASDVVLVPLLRGGGSPLKFIEGLAYGLPVLASAHAARLLEDGRAGEHFAVAGDAASFADAVIALLSDRAQAARLGSRGRQLALERYSVQTLVNELSR